MSRWAWAIGAVALATWAHEPTMASPAKGPVVMSAQTRHGGTDFRAADAWSRTMGRGVRGITIGPIENAAHPGVGYGTPAYDRCLGEVSALGGTWIALTPFGRVGDLSAKGVDRTFEAPFEDNRRAMRRAIELAHARGLRVMLVPHLWVESGEWRGKLAPPSNAAWAEWTASYRRFVLSWAKVAEETHVDLFSVGVELRSWVTTSRVASFLPIVRAIRDVYRGPLTYSANWDDVNDTLILGELDVIGINAFYPLVDHEGARIDALRAGGERVREKIHALAETWRRPVIFTEVGYTTRSDPALRPWEWPDGMRDVAIDEIAQADAYHGLLGPVLEEPYFAGFFVWRLYSDPDDVSQEAEWGFSPRGKLAELAVRDAFAAKWTVDGSQAPWLPKAATVPGLLR